MKTISSSKLLYMFLSTAIFFNILSLRVSSSIVFVIIFLYIVMVFLYDLSKSKMYYFVILYSLFLLFISFMIFVYHLYIYHENHFYHIQFFGSMQVIFLLFYSFFIDTKSFFIKYYYKIISFYVVVIFLSILLDYILLHTGHLELQPMYKVGKWAYVERPFGIFGSPSVNSTLLVFFYLLLIDQNNKQFPKKFYFFMVTVGIILQGSGSGMLAYLIMIIFFTYKNLYVRLFVLPLMLFTIYIVIQQGIFQKISLEYILYNYEYNLKLLSMVVTHGFNTIWDVLFGMDGHIEAPSDFGPLFFISKVGIIFFIFYSLGLLYLLFKVNSNIFKIAMIVLFVGAIHYPVMFAPVMNVFFPLVVLRYLQEYR